MKNILFIGNSYTYFNDMPEKIFAPMAEAAGYPANVTSVTRGGYHLFQFADPADEGGKQLRAAIAGNHYDVVVLQDQSSGPIFERAEFEQAVGDLMKLFALRKMHLSRCTMPSTYPCPSLDGSLWNGCGGPRP